MIVELRGARGEIAFSAHFKQGGRMIKILLTVAVLGSVGSFAGPAMAQGKQGEAQGGASWFSFPWTDSTSPQSDQRNEGQPKVRRQQPKTTTSPKIATVPAPKAKKANTPPRLDAQKEEQLYQEFLEWRNRQLFFASTP
jgi:hypothetical protein